MNIAQHTNIFVLPRNRNIVQMYSCSRQQASCHTMPVYAVNNKRQPSKQQAAVILKSCFIKLKLSQFVHWIRKFNLVNVIMHLSRTTTALRSVWQHQWMWQKLRQPATYCARLSKIYGAMKMLCRRKAAVNKMNILFYSWTYRN